MVFQAVLRKVVLSFIAAATALFPSLAQAQSISLLRDTEIETFLDDYSRPLMEVAGVNPDSIEILLVNDPSLNAFAGGRYMGFHTGLLTIADTPNEVEAVIAHEVAHLAGGHSASRADAFAAASRPVILSLLLAAGAVAAGAPEAGIGLLGLGQTVGTANALRFTRGQEATADQSSITYLDALGKSSKGALELWSKVRNSQIIRGRRINPYMQTHPLANDRLTALQQRAEASPYFHVEDSPEEIHRLHLIQAKIYGFLHDTNEVLRRYPLSDQSEPAHYARAVAYYRQSKIDEAIGEIQTLTEARPDHPYFHELKGQILFEYGRTVEAVEPYKRAIELRPDVALFRISLGRALLASNEPAMMREATKHFERALILERDNAFGWFELARAYGALGDEAMANLATAESRYHAGAHADANVFARRAIARLERGSTEWRQAMDIILATQPEEGGAPLPDAGEPSRRTPAPKPEPQAPPTRPDVPDPVPQLHNFLLNN